MVINGYEPKRLFEIFEEITRIPRGSFHEERIADFLCEFAEARGLEFYRDDMHNVLIKCGAEGGERYEAMPPVLLQGHTDMVCEKNSDVDFDFEKDPLDIYVDDDGFLRARGTTLGGDDGAAVAIMLALLDGECEAHPALECLFTVQEETGLDGAKNFDYGRISARSMINLDSESDGIATAGCAGGIFHVAKFPLVRESAEGGEAARIRIGGLAGGHSGENINSGRANANKLMGRVLLSCGGVRIVSIDGGSKDNAIPRECEAVVVAENYDELYARLNALSEEIKNELSSDDSEFFMTCERAEASRAASADDSRRILSFIASVHNGVIEMSKNIDGLVEFSRNLGIIRTENDRMRFVFSARSAIESQLDAADTELKNLVLTCGGVCELEGRYPGWEYAKSSALRDKYFEVYRSLTGRDASANVIHAGLECGIIKSHVPDMDMISIGPDMRDIHSPSEALSLSSFARTWLVVCGLLK